MDDREREDDVAEDRAWPGDLRGAAREPELQGAEPDREERRDQGRHEVLTVDAYLHPGRARPREDRVREGEVAQEQDLERDEERHVAPRRRVAAGDEPLDEARAPEERELVELDEGEEPDELERAPRPGGREVAAREDERRRDEEERVPVGEPSSESRFVHRQPPRGLTPPRGRSGGQDAGSSRNQ